MRDDGGAGGGSPEKETEWERVRREEEGKRRESRDNGLKPTWRAPVQGFQGFFFFFFKNLSFTPYFI